MNRRLRFKKSGKRTAIYWGASFLAAIIWYIGGFVMDLIVSLYAWAISHPIKPWVSDPHHTGGLTPLAPHWWTFYEIRLSLLLPITLMMFDLAITAIYIGFNKLFPDKRQRAYA